MHIVAGFSSDVFIEVAIEELIEQGTLQQQIVAVEMKSSSEDLFHSKIGAENVSLVDVTSAWAVVGALFGVIWGSKVMIGPLALGLLGYGVGVLIGFLYYKLIQSLKNNSNSKKKSNIDIILIIRLDSKEQAQLVASTLKKFHAISIGFRLS